MKKVHPQPPPRGRPREFDRDKVLDQITQVFWRQGYDGTSLSDLTEATGLNKPSLYAAFGDKEALFLAALRRYSEGGISMLLNRFVAEQDFRKGLRDLLRGYVAFYTSGQNACGCFVSNALSGSGAPDFPSDVLDAIKCTAEQGRNLFRKRIAQAAKAGELPETLSVDQALDYLMTVTAGIAQVSRTPGSTEAQLRRAVDVALSVFEA